MRLAAGDNVGSLDAARRSPSAWMRAEGPTVLALELMDRKCRKPKHWPKNIWMTRTATSRRFPEIRMIYARILLDAQRYAEATAQLQRMTQDQPDYPQAWLILGSLQLRENQLTLAQASLRRYIALAQKAPKKSSRYRPGSGLSVPLAIG